MTTSNPQTEDALPLDSGTRMPTTSYPQQYARLAQRDDARPLGPAYTDVAAEIACLEHNAAAPRPAYDQAAVER